MATFLQEKTKILRPINIHNKILKIKIAFSIFENTITKDF